MNFTTPYKDLLPPLSTQEFEALRASIDLERVRDPIVVDELAQVLDGHHRLAIAPDAPSRILSGLTEAEKLAYIYRVNFGRRNLSPAQKKERQKRMREVAKRLREENEAKNTQQHIAALLGVAQSTVSEWLGISIISADNAYTPDARVKIPPKHKPIIFERVEAGNTQEQVAADYGVSQPRIAQIVKAECKAQEKKREREEKAAQIGDIGILHGDFRELGTTIADDSIDLIFTDPPYDEPSVPLYTDLAALAARVLRPGGWCLAYCGQTWLSQYIQQMAQHLTYGWVFAIYHTGGDLRYRKLKVQNKWKPILGFYKPSLNVWWDWFPDMVSGGQEKAEHEWQQAEAEAKHFISALCPQTGVVLDPMCGSGTSCVAAMHAGRQWIGFDSDMSAVQSAKARLAETRNT